MGLKKRGFGNMFKKILLPTKSSDNSENSEKSKRKKLEELLDKSGIDFNPLHFSLVSGGL
jgi:hypothetical protein